ncbi:MAG TPA: hypothetical protein VE954_25210 [Oligoflexus sp.]|uniref:hypothetical protein n=1 Tax=Oligoflexus sp. TaxID=1971216 RepID=UPI002D4B656C|nr:hypothetical protein [Oligoflexus sp.]HYX36419.1 hypothetical protein [Oligoflexus sp.]
MKLGGLIPFGFVLVLPSCLMKGPAVVNEHLPVPDPHRQVLDVANFSDADWEYFGFYDGGTTFEHQYGGKGAGYYDYRFRGLDQPPTSFTVRARMSAESNERGRPHEKSEVTLAVNGVEIGTRTVVPDDTEGQVYEWKIEDPERVRNLNLKPGDQNILRFSVKEQASLRHGLCLYGAALSKDRSQDAVPITIEMPAEQTR